MTDLKHLTEAADNFTPHALLFEHAQPVSALDVTATSHMQVDVWSAGVMLYQMLFGKRPFGEGCSQEKILRDEVMLNAKTVYFPAKPALSAEGKEFISRCGVVCL